MSFGASEPCEEARTCAFCAQEMAYPPRNAAQGKHVTTTIESGEGTHGDEPVCEPTHTEAGRLRPLTLAPVASLSAGAVHAAAIGAHSDHPQAAKTFAVVALLQLLWGGI